MNKARQIIACLPADAKISSKMKLVFSITGSIKEKCSDCGKPIWVSPSTLILETRGIKPVCLLCVTKLAGKSDKLEIEGPSGEQLADLEFYDKKICSEN